jgi:hypothetical protein
MTTAAQNRRIHALKRQIAGFADDDYRGLLARFGVSSSRLLDADHADRLIGVLERLAGGSSASPRRASETVSGHYAGVLRALWLSAWNLGVVDEKGDKALIAFIERQTKLSHTRFLVDADLAKKAIEGLKAWIAREAGLTWPTARQAHERNRTLNAMCKIAVIEAIAARLAPLDPAFDLAEQAYGFCDENKIGGFGIHGMAPPELDMFAARIGARLRRRLAAKKAAA